MNCTEARKHWMLFLDSEGDPELHLHVRDHLVKCSACTRWFVQQRRLEQIIDKQLTAGDASPELWNRILKRTGIRPADFRRRRLLSLAGGLAAAAVVLALVAEERIGAIALIGIAGGLAVVILLWKLFL
jgi:predicted anti-sigma-YlaC factor YlaD